MIILVVYRLLSQDRDSKFHMLLSLDILFIWNTRLLLLLIPQFTFLLFVIVEPTYIIGKSVTSDN